MKTSFWTSSLPWLLAGLALPDDEDARSVARKAIRLFERADAHLATLYGRSHVLSKRFLDKDFQTTGTGDDDIALRPLLDEYHGFA